MLRLPAPGDEPGPLVVERIKEPADDDQEESHEENDHSHDDEGGSTTRLVAMIAVPGVLLLALFAWMLMPKDAAPTVPQQVPGETQAVADTGPEIQPPQNDRSRMEEVAKGFLNAATWEELMNWVVRPDLIRPKAAEWYAGTPYKAAGISRIEPDPFVDFDRSPGVVGMNLTTADFAPRQLTIVKTPEGFRVDWESWVGWSEMTWEDFKREKPVEPKAFRVICSPTDYYNFGFKSETEWTSFRLDSLDNGNFLYGYAPAGSELASLLRPLDGVEKRPVILKVRFPGDAASDNQVIIEGIVGEAWYEPSPAP